MKRAIFVSNTAFSLYVFRRALINAVKKEGWEVIVVSPSDMYADKVKALGVRHIDIDLDRKGKNPFRDTIFFIRLFWIYLRERPIVAHHFTIKPVIYGSVAARLAGIGSIVNTITGLGNVFIKERWITRLVRLMYRIALRFSSVTIFQNGDDRRQFIEWGLTKSDSAVVILGSGVDTSFFHPSELELTTETRKSTVTFLMAGRLLWDKGVREYVEACEIVAEKRTDCRFLLVGGIDMGNPSAVSREWIQRAVQNGAVEWHGEVFHDEMKDVMKKADVVVLPSYREGVPRVLLEAASMGKPIIASDCVGCRDVVEDGKTGVLVKPRSSMELASAMIHLAENGCVRRQMGEAGRERAVSSFDDARVIEQTFDAYLRAGCSIRGVDAGQKKRKAVFFSNSAMATYMFRRSLMSSMREKGWEVIAVGAPDKYSALIEKMGFSYKSLAIDRKGKNPIKDALLTLHLIKYFREEKPDLVHNFTIKPVIYGSIAARFLGVRSIVNTITGLGYVFAREGWLSRLVRFMYRMSIKRNTYTIFLNREDRNYFIKKGIVKDVCSDVICGEGVDAEYFSPGEARSESPRRAQTSFLMAARMLWDKGVKEYVEACEEVAKEVEGCRFLLVGGSDPGNPEAVPEEWLRSLKAMSIVEWVGEVMHDDMRDMMAKSDVIVLPSYYREGVPRVLLEAASMGKPIVTTDNVGCRDAVINGETGFLVPPRNSKLLAKTMLKLATDRELRTRMGRAGRNMILDKFDEKVILGRIGDIYRGLGVQMDSV